MKRTNLRREIEDMEVLKELERFVKNDSELKYFMKEMENIKPFYRRIFEDFTLGGRIHEANL